MNKERITLLIKFIEDEPENPFNSYALAMEYYEHKPSKALDVLVGLTQKFPSYLPTYFKLAHLHWEDEKWDLAEEIFLKGIRLAEEQEDKKAMTELQSAYQNFQFERD